MIKRSKIRRQPVQPRPSRIRRDPVPVAPVAKRAQAYPSEREVWIVAIGIILFAIAIAALTFGISAITGK